MSRIEEALKRAREAGPAASSEPGPTSAVFQDPWAVDEAAAAESPEGLPPDQTALPAAVTVVAPGRRPMLSDGPPQAAPRDQGDGAADAPAEPSPSLALFQGFNPGMVEKVVSTPDVQPAFVEQYRKLAGVLHHAQLEKNLKVVMVASAVAGEGKSLTATNLALTFSESYHRTVLLIDADLRRPTLHETFQVPNVSGLSDGLRAEKEEKLSLVQVSPRLTLLTAGRPDSDPMSSLTSGRMARVIEEASGRFDWVIIDTPPIGLLPDARLLAAMTDTTLLVIRAARTPYAFIRRAIEAIGRDRIFGVVLNCADHDAGTGGYSYYSYYDSYSREK